MLSIYAFKERAEKFVTDWNKQVEKGLHPKKLFITKVQVVDDDHFLYYQNHLSGNSTGWADSKDDFCNDTIGYLVTDQENVDPRKYGLEKVE